jgi:hypothetical protein
MYTRQNFATIEAAIKYLHVASQISKAAKYYASSANKYFTIRVVCQHIYLKLLSPDERTFARRWTATFIAVVSTLPVRMLEAICR